MLTFAYRLPSGVALFIASSSASADIVLKSDSVPGFIFALWAAIGFIALVLIGLWQDHFVDPVENDLSERKRFAFHRGFGGPITFLIGFLFGSAFLWIFGPAIALSVEPWLNPTGQAALQVAVMLMVVMTFVCIAFSLPAILSRVRRAAER